MRDPEANVEGQVASLRLPLTFIRGTSMRDLEANVEGQVAGYRRQVAGYRLKR
jgi:hypothetical protein